MAAFFWGRSRVFSHWARRLWALAMLCVVASYLAGATLEMMRRAAPISGAQMVVAIGAFSFLVAGVLSLVREWFGPSWNQPLRADKIAMSLLILTLAGRWLGGLALESNSLYFLGFSASQGAQIPAGWALFLGGATLLAASRAVASPDESVRRARNPRLATWCLVGVALGLAAPFGAHNGGAASVFIVASGVFCRKIWRSRADCPRFLRAPRFLLALGLMLLTVFSLWNQSRLEWRHMGTAWGERHQIVAGLGFGIALAHWLTRLRPSLRIAISGRFFDRALLHGTLAGLALAALLFGPGGALFWAFWPLCGLFFDLLATREHTRDPANPARNRDAQEIASELSASELARSQTAP